MNPQKPTSEHLLLIRGTHWAGGLSPAELQATMSGFYAWVDDLRARGLLIAAQPLMEEGRLVTSAPGSGPLVTDGAFAESKEAIAGYFLLAAPDLAHVLCLARACPPAPTTREDWSGCTSKTAKPGTRP
jgi:hypothetical protein